MSEPLFVDPEGLRTHSRPYEIAAQEWEALRAYVEGIRIRYYGAWGDDDLGEKFGPNFVAGLEAVEQGVGNLGQTLGYYGEGLIESSEIYGQARDDADQSTYQWLTETTQLGHAAPKGWNQLPAEAQVRQRAVHAPGQNTEGETFALLQPGRVAMRSVRPGDEPVPAQPAFRSRRLAVEGEKVVALQPAFMTSRAVAVRGEPAEPLQPLQPAVASKRMVAQAIPAEVLPAEVLAAEGEPLQPMMRARLALPGEPIPGVEPLQPAQPVLPYPSTAVPPPGQVWSDGSWLYTDGHHPVALRSLDSPYQHGAEATPYQPGTIPQPARGLLPPPGEFWSDGVYLYNSDLGVLAIDQLDSPYDQP